MCQEKNVKPENPKSEINPIKNLNKLRKIDLDVSQLSDDELKEVRLYLYDLGQLIFEEWWEEAGGSKNHVGSLHSDSSEDKM